MKWAPVLVGTALSLLFGGCSNGPDRPSGPESPSVWAEGQTHGRWHVVFTGHGAVTGDDNKVTLQPNDAADRDITHGALVTDPAAPADFRATLRVRTEEQLRVGKPNPWEVGWVLWRYRDPDHFYAVALKPNGWELSKQDPAYPGSQRFLVTGDHPRFPIGAEHTVDIRQVGATVQIRANDAPLTTFTDTQRPYLHGGFALYTEDARVTFTAIDVNPYPVPRSTSEMESRT